MTWLVDGKYVDVRTGRIDHRHIHVEDGKIVAVTAQRPVTASGPVIDLAGQFVLPGFFDCHVHICVDTHNPDASVGWGDALPGTIALFAAGAARKLLLSGITTARDVGGWDYHEIAVRKAIQAGWIPGPRLLCAGRILTMTSASTGYFRGMYAEADGPDAVRKAAREQLARGANFLKVMATGAVTSSEYENPEAVQFRPDELRAAVDIARDNFTHVAAHAHAEGGIRNAVEAGCHSIEHTVYGTEAVYKLMAERGTWLVPTTCFTRGMNNDPEFAARVPEHVRTRYAEVAKIHTANIRLARSLGVRIAMGSDAGTPGNHCGNNMQELEVMVHDCGFSALEAIRSATVDAAKMLGLDARLGALEPGMIADVIAVPADPLADIRSLQKVSFVMRDGCVARHDGGPAS